MSTYKIIIDATEDVEELSIVLGNHDDIGDVDPDEFVRSAAVCAALAFCNSKVSAQDRGEYKSSDYTSQLKRLDDQIRQYYEGEAYSIVRTSIDLFVSNIATSLISAIEDQTNTPIFSTIKDDLSLVFTVMDGKNETENPDGVSTTN